MNEHPGTDEHVVVPPSPSLSSDSADTEISSVSESRVSVPEPIAESAADPALTISTQAPTEPDSFAEMGLHPQVLEALTEMGFSEPMEVQRAVFRPMMAGRDLLVQSRTGSGKTAAFGIPLAQGRIDVKEARVQALVLCPTRELALQVANECEKIGRHIGLQVAAVYGGAAMGKQIDALKGGAQLVAGTPGRVLDHLRRGTLRLDHLAVLVLDEADEMLSMGFYEEISEILKRCPVERQTLLFSATIPDEIERISARHMREPEKLSLSGDFVGAQEITHAYYMVSGLGRSRDLVRVLRIEKPESAIIFCNTREETSLVADYMRKSGFDAEAISSDLTQSERERVMGRKRAGTLPFLVATDIAARGIDISDLSHVINYTFPESAEVYVHRTGRTGRAGRHGTAISLISPRELGNFYYLKLTYKIRPTERLLPSEEEESARLDGERLARLASELGGRRAAEEWRRLVRQLGSVGDGETIVAALLEHYFDSPAPTMDSASSEAEAEPATSVAVVAGEERTPRGRSTRAGRHDRKGREERRTRRDRHERPSRRGGGEAQEPVAAAPIAASPIASPIVSLDDAVAASHGEASGDGAREASLEAAHADEPSEAGTRKRRRRRSRHDRSQPPAASAPPTIELHDGREYWEVWADDRSGGQALADTAQSSIAPPRTATRIYLGLGTRDGLTPDEIERWVANHGVAPAQTEVRSSCTYLLVDESAAGEAIAKLHHTRIGERELVCERARRQ